MSMPRVDFYLLAPANVDSSLTTACRLVDKAYAAGHKVFVLLPTPEQVGQLDIMLWTFRDISFVPHSLWDSTVPSPVKLGQGLPETLDFDLLVNLTQALPAGFQRMRRIIEIVGGSEEQRAQGRELYKQYREQGCELHTHTLEK